MSSEKAELQFCFIFLLLMRKGITPGEVVTCYLERSRANLMTSKERSHTNPSKTLKQGLLYNMANYLTHQIHYRSSFKSPLSSSFISSPTFTLHALNT
jgi:hypothetical protein